MHERLSKFAIYTDEQLMHFIINGEEEAFEELYKRYGKRLLGYFTRMMNFNKTLAEDALQDLFLKIAECPEKFDHSRSFKTWVFTIASNQCKNFYRHKTIISEKEEELRYLNKDISEDGFLKMASGIDAKQFSAMLANSLEELSPEKKEVFILKYQEDKSLEEIALIQTCSVGTVKSRLHYTLKALEEKLQQFNPKI